MHSLSTINSLEKSGKINSSEKLRLKNIIQDGNGNPRESNEGEMNTMERMKRALKRLKVDKNREEHFGKKTKTYYTRTDDDRSRYNQWRKELNKKVSKGQNQIQSILEHLQRRTGSVTTLDMEEVDQGMKGVRV